MFYLLNARDTVQKTTTMFSKMKAIVPLIFSVLVELVDRASIEDAL